jgi:phosphonate transport system substrate-binding protein
MRKLLLAVCVVALCVIAVVVITDTGDPLTFVFTPGPGTDLAVIEEQFGEIVAEVGEYLGVETKIIVSTSAAATTEALRNGTADVGRYGPFGYIVAVEEVGVVPIVRESVIGKGEYYYGYVLGRPGMWEDPFTIDQIRDKTVAFAEPGSTSGYLFGITMMSEAGMALDDLGKYFFAGSHPAVIEAVLNGAVDAGFTNDRRLDYAIEEGVAIEGDNYVLLTQSPPIMLNPWAARPGIDVDELAQAFYSVSVEAMAKAKVERFVKALDSDYDFVRSMAELE